MERAKKRTIVSYCIMTLLFWASGYAFVPYLSAYAGTITGSAALVGVMLGAYGWAQLLLRMPIGILADRTGNHRFFIRLGCACNLIAAAGYPFAPNIYWMILFRTLNGVGSATWVATTVMFGTFFTGEARLKGLTLLNGCNYAGQLLASLAAMLVTARYGMRSAFALAAAVAVVPVLISMTLPRRATERKPLSVKELLTVAKSKWIWAVALMSTICHIMLFASLAGFTPQLALRLGANNTLLGLIQLLNAGCGALSTLFIGRYAIGRFGARNTAVAILFVQAVAVILQPFAASIAALYILVSVCGAATGASVSLLLGLATLPFPPEKQSAAMGAYQAIYSLGIVAGPTLAGIVTQVAGLDAAFVIVGCIGLLAPLLGLTMLRDERRVQPEA